MYFISLCCSLQCCSRFTVRIRGTRTALLSRVYFVSSVTIIGPFLQVVLVALSILSMPFTAFLALFTFTARASTLQIAFGRPKAVLAILPGILPVARSNF